MPYKPDPTGSMVLNVQDDGFTILRARRCCLELNRKDKTIARLAAERDAAVREREQAFRGGYDRGFVEGGDGHHGYHLPITKPDPDDAWDDYKAALAARPSSEVGGCSSSGRKTVPSMPDAVPGYQVGAAAEFARKEQSRG